MSICLTRSRICLSTKEEAVYVTGFVCSLGTRPLEGALFTEVMNAAGLGVRVEFLTTSRTWIPYFTRK